jgi:hypothetical protein
MKAKHDIHIITIHNGLRLLFVFFFNPTAQNSKRQHRNYCLAQWKEQNAPNIKKAKYFTCQQITAQIRGANVYN